LYVPVDVKLMSGALAARPIPVREGAFAAAEVYMAKGRRYGMYDLNEKSCMTYCADILYAGGRSDVPLRSTTGFAFRLGNMDF
jgi:hypothetical protein